MKKNSITTEEVSTGTVVLTGNVPASVVAPQLTVSAEAFAKWKAANDKAKAYEKEAKELRALAGIPDTKELAKLIGLRAGPDSKGNLIIVDGNGSPLANVSVWWKDGFEMPPSFGSRIT
jgi:hypothetical protein